MPVRRFKQSEWLPFHQAFHDALIDKGFPYDPDMNHPESQGVGPIPMNNPDGVRMSTGLTYINLSRHRLNLTIKANVLVRRVLFDGKKAIGAEVESSGERFTVEADEVVLSAGAIASPHLLMLSGVGPAEQLERQGIPVLHELPGVGQNLRDHPIVPVVYKVKEDHPQDPKAPRYQLALRYTATGSKDRNDMQILPSAFSSPIGAPDPYEQEGVRFTCVLELANGFGELTLTSNDPTVQPHLNYRYLEDAWDRERLREAVRLAMDLVEKHTTFQDVWAARDEAVLAGLAEHAPGILEPLAKMGPDLWSVVDRLPRLGRVFFAAHLRMPRPADAVLSGWHAVNCLREWRGDTHWALVTAADLSGPEASILHNAWIGYEKDWLATSRGSTADETAAAWDALEARGLAADGEVNASGLDLRQRMEDETDRLTALPWTLLGEAGSIRFAEEFEPPCEQLLARVDVTAGPNYQPASRIRH